MVFDEITGQTEGRQRNVPRRWRRGFPTPRSAGKIFPGERKVTIDSYLLNLAGEYRVCSELIKRGIFATITYGNRKGADVYAISNRQNSVLKIEVKTSQRSRFVTSITQKGLAEDPAAPDLWVLFHLKPGSDGTFTERFFILTHDEICRAQAARNQAYAEKYHAKHGKQPDFASCVDNVTISDVEAYEDQWAKIRKVFASSSG
ncbi:MAG: hypothetical protein HQ592_04990 [Planctomycetes bacterium]|jgi:hypothetical protein|nr:hypothetical protein [Planctomycetota bacterium]